MSAESIYLRSPERTVAIRDLRGLEPQEVETERSPSPVDFVYRMLATSDPTAREVQREQFLLDCD